MRIYDRAAGIWLERDSVDAREMLDHASGRYSKTEPVAPPQPGLEDRFLLAVSAPPAAPVDPPKPRRYNKAGIAAMHAANARKRAEKRAARIAASVAE